MKLWTKKCSSLIAVNKMFTSHCGNLSTYIPSLFRHAISSRSDHATVFSRYSHVFEKNRKRSSCRFVPKRAIKRKQRNCFDKDWAYKHAASDKGSHYSRTISEKGRIWRRQRLACVAGGMTTGIPNSRFEESIKY